MQLSTVPIALIRGTWVAGLQVTPWLDLRQAEGQGTGVATTHKVGTFAATARAVAAL